MPTSLLAIFLILLTGTFVRFLLLAAKLFERELALLVALQGASSWKVFFQATVRG